jgi:ABC-type microcin C transport system duplicated ATPase subunit YejF
MESNGNLLEVRDLRRTFALHAKGNRSNGKGNVPQCTVGVEGVNFSLRAGDTLGIVGESGCGKTTLARMLVRLLEPDAGEMRFRGEDWRSARGTELRKLRRRIQMVFQDPIASLNPRMRAGSIVGEPLEIHEPQLSKAERTKRVAEILEAVGLKSETMARYPHEFSGGQRQRIGIARALILRPELVVADEPVSALDVSVGAQILELLARLRQEFSLTLVLISHSLPVVAQLATDVAVMRAGRFVETGPVDRVLRAPENEYTRALVAAVPEIP